MKKNLIGPTSLYTEMSDLIKGHQTICCKTKWFKYLGPVKTYPFLFENGDFLRFGRPRHTYPVKTVTETFSKTLSIVKILKTQFCYTLVDG